MWTDVLRQFGHTRRELTSTRVPWRQDANGSVHEVRHHREESARSLSLKRLLASHHQLIGACHERVRAADEPLDYEALEEDHHGPSAARYSVRRGLVGRVLIEKEQNWEPTRRRPAAVQQSARVRARFEFFKLTGQQGSLAGVVGAESSASTDRALNSLCFAGASRAPLNNFVWVSDA